MPRGEQVELPRSAGLETGGTASCSNSPELARNAHWAFRLVRNCARYRASRLEAYLWQETPCCLVGLCEGLGDWFLVKLRTQSVHAFAVRYYCVVLKSFFGGG